MFGSYLIMFLVLSYKGFAWLRAKGEKGMKEKTVRMGLHQFCVK